MQILIISLTKYILDAPRIMNMQGLVNIQNGFITWTKKEHNTHIEYSSQQNADLPLWLHAKPHYNNYDIDSIIHYHNKHRH